MGEIITIAGGEWRPLTPAEKTENERNAKAKKEAESKAHQDWINSLSPTEKKDFQEAYWKNIRKCEALERQYGKGAVNNDFPYDPVNQWNTNSGPSRLGGK